MPLRNVPPAGLRYWATMSVASVFGANLGDTVSHGLRLGHVRGLLPLALAFALVLAAERRSRRPGEAWYWLAIVVLRTAATNLADLATHDLRLGYAAVVAGLALLLAAMVGAGGRGAAALRAPEVRAVPSADGRFWAAMLVAGTLGTASGDGVSDALGLGTGPGSLACAAALAVVFLLRAARRGAAGYWPAVVGVRTTGTTLGDFVVGRSGLLPGTACTGVLFALAVLAGGRASRLAGPGGGVDPGAWPGGAGLDEGRAG